MEQHSHSVTQTRLEEEKIHEDHEIISHQNEEVSLEKRRKETKGREREGES